MDLISTISSSLGVDEQAAKGAVGSILGMLKQEAPAEAFAAVEQKVPEAGEWMAAAPSPEPAGGGGGLGDLLGSVAGAFGLGESTPGAQGSGSGGGILGTIAGLGGLLSALSKLGLTSDTLIKLLPLVVQFLQSRLGANNTARLLEAVPALSVAAAPGGAQPSGDSPLGGLGSLFK